MFELLPEAWVVAPGYVGIWLSAPPGAVDAAVAAEVSAGAAEAAAPDWSVLLLEVLEDDLLLQAVNASAATMASDMVKRRNVISPYDLVAVGNGANERALGYPLAPDGGIPLRRASRPTGTLLSDDF